MGIFYQQVQHGQFLRLPLYHKFNVNTSGFGEVLGYEIGSYPDTQVGSTTSSFLSSVAPQITSIVLYWYHVI